MKKLSILLLFLIPFVSCMEQVKKGTTSEVDSLKMQLELKDSLINEVFSSLSEITSNLNRIKDRENVITSVVSSGELAKEPIAQITEDIDAIEELLKTNRETISRLEKSAEQLRKANIKTGSLESLVNEMSAQIEKKDEEISRLKSELSEIDHEVEAMAIHVDDLTSQVEVLKDSKHKLEGEIREKGEQLNLAYYIVGSRKDLTNRDIIYKSGFIGRTLQVNENRSLEAFTQVDARNFDEVIIGKKNVDIVTSHPDGSYEFVMNDSGVFMSLVITDKEKFWEYSKVLVISYK